MRCKGGDEVEQEGRLKRGEEGGFEREDQGQ